MDKVSGFWALLDALGNKPDEKRTRSTATYSGTDSDGTPWVTFPGSSEPTPVRGSVTSDLSMGDEVEVEVSNGRVSIVGNNTDPSLGTKAVARAIAPALEKAEQTERIAREATEGVAAAQTAVKAATDAATQAAANAQAAIDASDQHFFSDSNGVHVSTEEDAPTGTRNILINSLGVILRKASTILAQFTEGEVAFYDGSGNQAANVVASFGTGGAQIGKSGESHMELDYHSMKLIDKEGDVYFLAIDLRDESGVATLIEYFVGDGSNVSFSVRYQINAVVSVFIGGVSTSFSVPDTGNRTTVILNTVPENGQTVTITYETKSPHLKAYTFGERLSNSLIKMGPYSVAEGSAVESSGYASHAEGNVTVASGAMSHAEGSDATASGRCSHVEGEETVASGTSSHCEGFYSTASGAYAHAEGLHSTASGYCSHAEGSTVTASGYCSHAQNRRTIAASRSQTAIGILNIEDANDTYALIIGNGTEDNNNTVRSNALTVDWDGNVECGTVNGIAFDPVGTVLSETDTTDVSTSTNTDVASITLTAGTWLVNARLQFASNSTGRRAAKLSTTSVDSSNVISTDARNAVDGGATNIQTERLFALSSQSTVYLIGWQNSGSTLSCTGDIQAVRLAVMNDVPLSTVYTSSSAPTSAQGSDGDVWLVV